MTKRKMALKASLQTEQDYKIYSLPNDFVFKWIFGQEKHERYIICMLNALLMLEGDNCIESLTILNPFNYKEFATQKSSVIDTKVRDHRCELYNIEVQVLPDAAFVARTVYYLSKLYSSQMKAGEDYNVLQKATGLSILGFNLFTTSAKILESFEFRNSDGNLALNNTLALHYVDLTKFNVDKPRELRSRFEKWLHILKFGELYGRMGAVLARELKEEEGVEMVITELKKINADAEKRQLMEAREKSETCMRLSKAYAHKAGREEGREEGRKEGLAEGKKTSITTILNARFQTVPVELMSAIEQIYDREILEKLLVQAALTTSLDAFADFLKTTTSSALKKS